LGALLHWLNMSFVLTEDNFLLYAIKHYDNPACKGIDEFEDDLKRFSYLKRLFRKKSCNNGLKERLIMNHIVILSNLFGVEHIASMLFLKIENEYWSQLKTYLVYLSGMPESPIAINELTIHNTDIPLDQELVRILRAL
jgi:hypothetical protein